MKTKLEKETSSHADTKQQMLELNNKLQEIVAQVGINISHHRNISVKKFPQVCTLNPCHTRAAFSRCSHSVLTNCRTPRWAQYDHNHCRSNAVATQLDTVGSHRTQSDGAHFEYAENKHRRSAIARCSNKCAVGSP